MFDAMRKVAAARRYGKCTSPSEENLCGSENESLSEKETCVATRMGRTVWKMYKSEKRP